jgi:phosphatidylglycerophosphate synthase
LPVLTDVRRIYRESLKPADSLFNLYLARPLAAVVVGALADTGVTPNQVTFAALATMIAGSVVLGAVPGWWGLALGIAGVELSYIFDCADGQLARLTKRTSEVGALLDFLMDELKAYLLVGALSARWFFQSQGGPEALIVGLASLIVVASALSLTRFVRTPEYARATGTKQLKHGEAAGAAHRADRSKLWPVEMAARAISQYPVTLPVFAIVDRLDLFLYAYGGLHLLYVGRTALPVLWKLGRRPKPAAGDGGG